MTIKSAIFLSALLSSCTYLATTHRKYVIDVNTCGDKIRPIRTDGYYYLESEINDFPYFKTSYGGCDQDTTKPFVKKIIKPLTLHKDGTVITFRNFSGFQENHAFDYSEKCMLKDSNSIESAKSHFRCFLKNYKSDNPIWDKGIFKTSVDSIIIQYYVNWIGSYYLVEKSGKIINDSTFTFTRRFDYFTNKEKRIDEVLKFQRTEFKPDSSNYILQHKRQFRKKKKNIA